MTMAKIQKSSQTLTPFGGINFTNEEFSRCGLSQLIDNQLGYRQSTKGFKHSDIIRSWFDIFFCGGDVAEDIQEHLRQTLEAIPQNKVPSADTLLRALSELSIENQTVKSSAGNSYSININKKMLDLNIKMLLMLKLINKKDLQDLDFDNQILENEKYDAKKTYKMNTGYFPGIATIGKHIVYIENRDGNANVKMNQAELLMRCFNLLNDN
jgi:hypothetical protein